MENATHISSTTKIVTSYVFVCVCIFVGCLTDHCLLKKQLCKSMQSVYLFENAYKLVFLHFQSWMNNNKSNNNTNVEKKLMTNSYRWKILNG